MDLTAASAVVANYAELTVYGIIYGAAALKFTPGVVRWGYSQVIGWFR